MKKLTWLTFISIVVFSVVISGCSKGGDAGGVGGIFIPDLSNTWVNKADATNTFFFINTTPNVNTSTFDLNENPIGGGSQFHAAGSFTNHQIQFTYDNASGAKSNKSYSGTIDDASKVITLTSADLGSLVLQKQ